MEIAGGLAQFSPDVRWVSAAVLQHTLRECTHRVKVVHTNLRFMPGMSEPPDRCSAAGSDPAIQRTTVRRKLLKLVGWEVPQKGPRKHGAHADWATASRILLVWRPDMTDGTRGSVRGTGGPVRKRTGDRDVASKDECVWNTLEKQDQTPDDSRGVQWVVLVPQHEGDGVSTRGGRRRQPFGILGEPARVDRKHGIRGTVIDPRAEACCVFEDVLKNVGATGRNPSRRREQCGYFKGSLPFRPDVVAVAE